MEARIARLESDVSHIQTDVADIKVDLRSLRDKLGDTEVRLTGRIENLDARLSGKIDGLRTEIHSVRIWGFGLYITMTGALLAVMARGFGWI